MSDLDKFRCHAIQARRLVPYTADKPTRIILELLSEELELKIAEIERRQAVDASVFSGPLKTILNNEAS
jgi:hypothetical protein